MDLKKIIGDTQNAVDRLLQVTNEAFGRSERTEYDLEFTQLLAHAEVLYKTTKKIIGIVEFWVNPLKGRRLEDMSDKIEKLLSDHKSFQLNVPMKYPTECLGDVLLSASVDIGKKYAYGQALKKCGEYHRTLAVIENERNQAVERRFLLILFHFMQCDWVGLQSEMKKLQVSRLNYDTARNKIKKETQPDSEVTLNLEKLRVEFESQLKETRKKLEGMKMVHQTLLAALKEFVGAECRYFKACLAQAQAAAEFIGQLPDGP